MNHFLLVRGVDITGVKAKCELVALLQESYQRRNQSVPNLLCRSCQEADVCDVCAEEGHLLLCKGTLISPNS